MINMASLHGRTGALAALLLIAAVGSAVAQEPETPVPEVGGPDWNETDAVVVTEASPDVPAAIDSPPLDPDSPARPIFGYGFTTEDADGYDPVLPRGGLDPQWSVETSAADVNFGFTIEETDGPVSVMSIVTTRGGGSVRLTSDTPFNSRHVLVMVIKADELDRLELQIASTADPNFTYPSIPLSQLTAPSQGISTEVEWQTVALPIAPLLNIFGNASLPFGEADTIILSDADRCGDGVAFFVKNLALVEGQPTPEEALAQAESLALFQQTSPITTERFRSSDFHAICQRWRLFWCSTPTPAPTPPPGSLPIPSPGVPATSLSDYGRNGRFSTSMKTVSVRRPTLGVFPAAVYYPSAGRTSSGVAPGKFPVICFGKGHGTQSFLYRSTMMLLASHGFIVIAPDSPSLFNGRDMTASMLYVQQSGRSPGSFLYGKVDEEAGMGTTGHSMGGGGAISAAAASTARSLNIKATAPCHPAPWQGGGVGAPIGPMFLMAGALDTVTQATLIKLRVFDTPAFGGEPKIMATMRTAAHNEIVDWVGQRRWKAYMVAWFRLYLQGEAAAAGLFWGEGRSSALMADSRMLSVLRKGSYTQ